MLLSFVHQYLAIASRTNSSLPEITAPSGTPFTDQLDQLLIVGIHCFG